MPSLNGSGIGVRIVSAIPGRIRLRADDRRGREVLASVAETMRVRPEVTSAQLRPGSGSLVVGFDPAHRSSLDDVLRAAGIDTAVSAPTASGDAASAVGTAVSAANDTVARRLDGIDLRTLVPLGLGLLAARRAMRGDDRLSDAPWYVLAWYASETFTKFQNGARAPTTTSGDKER